MCGWLTRDPGRDGRPEFEFALFAPDVPTAKKAGADPAEDDAEGEDDDHNYPLVVGVYPVPEWRVS